MLAKNKKSAEEIDLIIRVGDFEFKMNFLK